MRVTVLMENTGPDSLLTAHGLSFYVETDGCAILVDSGPDAGFAENAARLGIDLKRAGLCVLSHAHHDHGGGLGRFLEINPTAPVYLRPQAFFEHTGPTGYNGLDRSLEGGPRLRYTETLQRLTDTALVFSGAEGGELVPDICAALFENGEPDAFLHEQNLLIEEDGRLFLFGGCAHCGIVNIVERAREIAGRAPDYVFSGFHLTLRDMRVTDDFARGLAERLLSCGGVYHTCHCTGPRPYEVMKEVMGDRLLYAATGQIFEY